MHSTGHIGGVGLPARKSSSPNPDPTLAQLCLRGLHGRAGTLAHGSRWS